MARAIQRHFGAPQDIEFAIEAGQLQLHILQSRPITRINFAPGTGEWTNADFRDGGVSCQVCTPLMWAPLRLDLGGVAQGISPGDPVVERRFSRGSDVFSAC